MYRIKEEGPAALHTSPSRPLSLVQRGYECEWLGFAKRKPKVRFNSAGLMSQLINNLSAARARVHVSPPSPKQGGSTAVGAPDP